MAALSLSERLRAATQPFHARLDSHPILRALLHTDLTLDRYALALAALHGPQAALEQEISRYLPSTWAALFTPRLPALERDLAALQIAALPLASPPPRAKHDASMLGLLYVVEGARLGSAVIIKKLQQTLPATASREYFGGDFNPRRWRAFGDYANLFGKTQDAKAAILAAQAAFECYRLHLDACLSYATPS